MHEPEMTPEEQEELFLAAGEFIAAVRQNYEMAAAHAEIFAQGVVYLMRTQGVDEVRIDEADAALISAEMESKNLHLHMEVEGGEDEDGNDPWTLIFKIVEVEDAEQDHPVNG